MPPTRASGKCVEMGSYRFTVQADRFTKHGQRDRGNTAGKRVGDGGERGFQCYRGTGRGAAGDSVPGSALSIMLPDSIWL